MATTFDTSYYLSNNPDVLEAILSGAFTSAEQHYRLFGEKEGRMPNAYFNPQYYLSHNVDVLTAITSGAFKGTALEHYEQFGEKEGRAFAEGQTFNETAYLAANADVAAAVASGAFQSGYEHYVLYGAAEGRAGSGVTTGSGQTFTLTTGVDTFIGTSANDTFTAAEIATGKTWSVADSIDGGAGNDVFNVTQSAAISAPVGVVVKNIEVANLLSGATGNTIDTTGWTGLTELNVTGVTAQTVTAAATTDVNVTGSTATGATAVNGGLDVTVTETGANGGSVNIGATTAAAGTVTVNSTILSTGGSTGNAITVKGGAEISITQKGANAVNTTVTDGAVTVTGTSATKTVTVVSDAAATAAATVVGHVNGAVSITDANSASTTAAGSIETVSLTNFAAATVNSGALKTLNLAGTGATVDASALGALTTPANTALALNVKGLTTTGAVTIDSDIATLNVAGSTTASTIASLVAGGVKSLNISGDAKVTFTADTLSALTDVTVTNTAGAALGTAIGKGVTFTGGAGSDAVALTTGFTKAITMGAGDDTVTYGGAAGTGGSVAAGDGVDTIVMTGAQADAADADSTFNSKFTGFEVLSITTGATETVDLVGINGVSKVATIGANDLTLNNLASGGTLTLTGASTTLTVGVRDAAFNSADSLNVSLSNSTAATVGFGTVTAASVETINISTVDAGTGTNTAATQDTLTLVATAATKIVVSGHNGLDLTNAGNKAVTTFDASGVTADGTDDTAANLGVKFASANDTASASVSITGGAGDDTLTGNAAKDTIIGGAGKDTITGGTGVDTLTGGAGADKFVVAAGDAGITGAEKITDFTLGVGGDTLDLATTALVANQTATNVTSAVSGAVDVTATVTNGIITLGGADAALVDTIGEIKAVYEALDTAATAEVAAIVLNGQTYVLTDDGTDVVTDIIQLTGVTTATALSTTAAAGTITIA